MKDYSWQQLVIGLSLIYLPLSFVAWVAGYLSEVLLISFFLHLLWHYIYLFKLNDWLWLKKTLIVPKTLNVFS